MTNTELIHVDRLEKMTKILKAIAHHERLQIVNILLNGECQVGKMVITFGIRQSHISQHLSILKFSGIVKPRRDGNKVYYLLANDNIKRIMESIIAEI